MPSLIAFVLPRKPLSYNAFRDASRKASYTSALRDSYLAAGGHPHAVTAPHYGIVYHLHRPDDPTDADNISKPVWDALRRVAYEDDALVELRIAGKLRIGRGLPATLNLTGVPRDALRRLTVLAGKQSTDHMLYVELGTLRSAMFAFGLGA